MYVGSSLKQRSHIGRVTSCSRSRSHGAVWRGLLDVETVVGMLEYYPMLTPTIWLFQSVFHLGASLNLLNHFATLLTVLPYSHNTRHLFSQPYWTGCESITSPIYYQIFVWDLTVTRHTFFPHFNLIFAFFVFIFGGKSGCRVKSKHPQKKPR